jgi:hypothetical protein
MHTSPLGLELRLTPEGAFSVPGAAFTTLGKVLKNKTLWLLVELLCK